MELQLLSFEQAKAFKELGFPQLNNDTILQVTKDFTNTSGDIFYEGNRYLLCDFIKRTYNEYPNNFVAIPSLELISKWLREEKNIRVLIKDVVGVSFNGSYKEAYKPYIVNNVWNCDTGYVKFEDALSAGIDKAIEILNQSK